MKREYDIVVVGAGPAGSMAARYAAEQGVSVLLLEKDKEIGSPVRCGEAVSKNKIEEFISPDEKWIAAHINKFSLNAPDGNEVIIQFSEEGYILDRKTFDFELAKTAENSGADILTSAYVNGLLIEDDKVAGVKLEHKGEQKEIKSKIVIAADGVESRIGRWAGLKTHIDFRDMECCFQINASDINVDKNTCYFYLGENVAPNGYFWIFPKRNKNANIGLGVSGIIGKKKSAQSYLNDFMQKNYPDAQIVNKVAGGVPCSITLDRISAPGIMLAGDAARQVNPLSGGGIASGMIGGSIAGKIAGEAVKMKKLDHIFSYDKVWHEKVGKRHEIYNKIKNGIYNFSDEKFNNIAHSFNKIPNDKRTLGRLFTTALINQPSLLIDVAKVFVV